MAGKSKTIQAKVSLTPDIQNFISKIQSGFKNVKSLGIDKAVESDVDKAIELLNDLSKAITDLGNGKVNTSNFSKAEKQITDKLKALDNRTTALEKNFSILLDTMSKTDGSNFAKELKEISENMQNLQTTTEMTVGALHEFVNGAEISRQQLDGYEKLDSVLANIQKKLSQDSSAKLESGLKAAEEQLSKVYDRYVDSLAVAEELENVQDKSVDSMQKMVKARSEVINNARDLNILIDQFGDKFSKNFLSTKIQSTPLDQIQDELAETLIESKAMVIKWRDDVQDEINKIEPVPDIEIANKKSGGKQINIPIDISTSQTTLIKRALAIVNAVNSKMADNPIEIELDFTTAWGKRKNKELLKRFQSQIDDLSKDTDVTELQKLADSITASFGDQIKIHISTDQDLDEIVAKLEEVRKKIHEKFSINPYVELTDESKEEVQGELDELSKYVTLKIANLELTEGALENTPFENVLNEFHEISGEIKNIFASLQEGLNNLSFATVDSKLSEIKELVFDVARFSFGNNQQLKRIDTKLYKSNETLSSIYAEGIKEGTSEVEQAATDMTQSAIDAVKKAQDSNSPSKKTEKLGKDFADGEAKGILKNTQKAEKAGRELAEAAKKGFKEGSQYSSEAQELFDLLNAQNGNSKVSEEEHYAQLLKEELALQKEQLDNEKAIAEQSEKKFNNKKHAENYYGKYATAKQAYSDALAGGASQKTLTSLMRKLAGYEKAHPLIGNQSKKEFLESVGFGDDTTKKIEETVKAEAKLTEQAKAAVEQVNRLDKGFEWIVNKTKEFGNFNLAKKTDKAGLSTIVDQFIKYQNQGGEKQLSDITNNKKALEKLTNEYIRQCTVQEESAKSKGKNAKISRDIEQTTKETVDTSAQITSNIGKTSQALKTEEKEVSNVFELFQKITEEQQKILERTGSLKDLYETGGFVSSESGWFSKAGLKNRTHGSLKKISEALYEAKKAKEKGDIGWHFHPSTYAVPSDITRHKDGTISGDITSFFSQWKMGVNKQIIRSLVETLSIDTDAFFKTLMATGKFKDGNDIADVIKANRQYFAKKDNGRFSNEFAKYVRDNISSIKETEENIFETYLNDNEEHIKSILVAFKEYDTDEGTQMSVADYSTLFSAIKNNAAELPETFTEFVYRQIKEGDDLIQAVKKYTDKLFQGVESSGDVGEDDLPQLKKALYGDFWGKYLKNKENSIFFKQLTGMDYETTLKKLMGGYTKKYFQQAVDYILKDIAKTDKSYGDFFKIYSNEEFDEKVFPKMINTSSKQSSKKKRHVDEKRAIEKTTEAIIEQAKAEEKLAQAQKSKGTDNAADSAKGIGKESEALSEVKENAEKAATSKEEFASANEKVLSSIIDSLKGLKNEGNAFEQLNKLINNLNSKGNAKLENTVKGLHEIVNALSAPLNGDTFIDALERIARSGSNLSDIASILSASKKDLLAAQDVLDNIAQKDINDFIYNNQDRIEAAAKTAMSDMAGDGGSFVNISKMESTKDGLIEVIGLMRTADNEFKQYTVRLTKDLDVVGTNTETNTARIAKQVKIYAQVQQAFERMFGKSTSETDEAFVDAEADPDLWEKLINWARDYGYELGNIQKITRQTRQNGKGELLESFSVIGDKGHVTIGAEDEIVASSQTYEDISKLNARIKALTKSAKEYYALAERKAMTGRLNQAEADELAKIENEYADITSEVQRLTAMLGDATSISKDFEDAQRQVILSFSQLQSEYTEKALTKLEDAKNNPLGKDIKYTEEFVSNIQDAINKAEELRSIIKTKGDNVELWDEATIQRVTELHEEIDKVTIALKNNNNIIAKSGSVDKLLSKINKDLNDNTAMPKELRREYEALRAEIDAARVSEEGLNSVDFRKVTNQFNHLHEQMLRINKTGKSMVQSIAEAAKSQTTQFIARYFSLQDWIRYGREVFENIKNIDSALTELRKVSDASTERLTQNFETSAKTAQELGATISQVINITSDWARLGYNVDEAEKLAKVTTMFETVGDNMNAETASGFMISTLQGFQMAAEEAESVVDKYNEVANNFAIDTRGIGEALTRSAASFYAANTDLSKAIALVTAANEVVQNPEAVGTTFKTLSARIRGAKTELEDLGEEEDEFTKTTSKLRDLVKGLTGFDIMKDEKTFKDIYEILLGIGEEWDKLTDVERASLGEALAGKRNANTLYAVLGNLDTLQEAYKAAEESAGSAAKEQQNYAKSIQYSVDRLKASIEEISHDLVDSQDVKGIIEFFNRIVQGADKVVEEWGLIAPIITAIGSAALFKNFGKIKTAILGIGELGKAIQLASSVIPQNGIFDLQTASNIANAINGVSEAQKIATISALKLSEAEATTVLAMAGVTEESIAQSIANGTLVVSQQRATASTFSLSAAFKGLATTIGISEASLGAIMIALIALGGIAYGVYKYNKRWEEMASKAEEARTNIQGLKDSYKELETSAKSLAKRYDELSKGVDTFNNKNISLTDEDYAEYLSITNQLAEKFPQLYQTLDENGNAILNFSDKTKDATGNLEEFLERERDIANYKINQQLGDLFGGVQVKEKELNDAETALENGIALSETYSNELSELINKNNKWKDAIVYNIDTSTDAGAMFYNSLMRGINEFYNSLDAGRKIELADIFTADNMINSPDGSGVIDFYLNTLLLNDEEKERLRSYIGNSFDDIKAEYIDNAFDLQSALNQAQYELDAEWIDFRANLIDATHSKASYKGLNESSKQLADALVGNLSSDVAKEMDEQHPENWVRDNIVAPLLKAAESDESSELSSLITQLISLNIDDTARIDLANQIYELLDGLGIKIDLTPVISGALDLDKETKDAAWNVATNGNETDAGVYSKLLDATKEYDSEEKRAWNKAIANARNYEEAINLGTAAVKRLREETEKTKTSSSFDNAKFSEQVNKLDALQNAYKTFRDNVNNKETKINLDISDVESLRETFGDIEGFNFDEFEIVVTSDTSGIDDIQKKFDEALTAYGNSRIELEGINEENKNMIRTQLEMENATHESAEAFVEYHLLMAKAQEAVAESGENLETIKASDIKILQAEGVVAGETAQQIALLALAEQTNTDNITTANSVASLVALAKTAGLAAAEIQALEEVMGMFTMADNVEAKGGRTAAEAIRSAARQRMQTFKSLVQEKLNEQTEGLTFDIPDLTTGAGGAGKDAGDAYVEAFEKELQKLDDAYERGEMSLGQYLDAYKALIDKFFKDREEYAEEYAKRLHDYLSKMKDYYDGAISGVTKLLDRRINAVQKQKDAAIKAIEEERDAAIGALEERKKAIDKEIKAKQKQIKSIDKEIKAIQDANKARKDAIDLAKAQYELEKAQMQRTQFVLKAGQLVYQNDPESVRNAQQDLTDKEDDAKIAKLEKQKEIIESQIELLEEEKEAIDEQIDALNEMYDKMIKDTEAMFDSLLDKLEKQKEKWEELAEIKEVAEAYAAIQEVFGELGYTVDDVLNDVPGAFDDFKNKYLTIMSDMSSGNQPFLDGLKYATGEATSAFGTISDNAGQMKDALGEVASATQPLQTAASNIKAVGDNAQTASTGVGNLKTSTDGISSNLDSINGKSFQPLIDNIDGIKKELEAVQKLLSDDPTGLGGALDALNSIDLEQAKTQFNNLSSAISGAVSALNGGGASGDTSNPAMSSSASMTADAGATTSGGAGLVKAIEDIGTTTETVMGASAENGKGEGVLGKFGEFKTTVGGIDEAIGTVKDGSDAETLIGAETAFGEATQEVLYGGKDDESGVIPAFTDFNTQLGTAKTNLETIKSTLEGLNGKTFTVTLMVEGGEGVDKNYTGTAIPTGEFKSIYGKASFAGTANMGGKWGFEGGKTLISELGTELVVYPNGTFRTFDKPQIVDLPRGSVIFNHLQTADILSGKNVVGKKGKSNLNGTSITPLSHAANAEFDRIAKQLLLNSSDIRMDIGNIKRTADDINNTVQNITTNNTNSSPVINVGDLNFTLTGVTSTEVMNQIGKELERTFDGLALNAYQRAMKH